MSVQNDDEDITTAKSFVDIKSKLQTIIEPKPNETPLIYNYTVKDIRIFYSRPLNNIT